MLAESTHVGLTGAEHLVDEVRGPHCHEVRLALAGHGFCQQRLATARRSIHERTLGWLLEVEVEESKATAWSQATVHAQSACKWWLCHAGHGGNEHAYHKAKAFKEVSMLDREGDHLLQLSLHVLQAANVIKGGARVLQQHTPQTQPQPHSQPQRHTQ